MAFRNPLVTLLVWALACSTCSFAAERPLCISGVYPHLTMHNQERECGTGAVVPWQGSLWAITYAPHKPGGSTDKLYEITPDLQQQVFPGSVGGTPANRMIHPESNQLLIGPYLIDANKQIRVIPPSKMFGRLTGNARHLLHPERMVYYATMEEGLYEVDVNTLKVTCLLRDGNSGAPEVGMLSELPGYHGKGLYSGHGQVVYANNGTNGARRLVDPTIPSGALATWPGEGDWQLVRRNQFTEVTGPGGLQGNGDPQAEPIWSLGWDARSVILAMLDADGWHYYRLPKASHSYDGAHGWNTEWPRIREIGEDALLATMHGTLWRFPAGFGLRQSAGIAPRSNYLKVIGDFCRWDDRIVFGCDDSAQSEFANTRDFKARHGSPRQSNSNLWFVDPARLDQLGPAIGRGSVWLRDDVAGGDFSDPYLFGGYDYRQLYLTHASKQSLTFSLQVDREGNEQWENLREITVPAGAAVSYIFSDDEAGAWIRLEAHRAAKSVTAHFQYRNRDDRDMGASGSLFAGVATTGSPAQSVGLMRSLAYNRLGLVAASSPAGEDAKYYELNQQLELVPVDDPTGALSAQLATAVRQPENTIQVDDASVVVVEDGQRYRLPKNNAYLPAVAKDVQPNKTLADYLSQSLTRSAQVSASSTHDHYQPSLAVDGTITDESRWIGRNEGDTWIELDLGRPQTFRSIWVVSGWQHSSRYVAADFDVQIKLAGQWQTIANGSVRDNTLIEYPINLEQPITTQHIRVASPTNDFLRIYEVAVFADQLDILPPSGLGVARVCREVATERDLLNVHGTFYELPARNAQGMAKIRPVSTHNLVIHDFCSHNGLLLLTGIDGSTSSDRIFRSADGHAAVWAGVVDDLWSLGKPRGTGGPWHNTKVQAGEYSDRYLMTGYDRKTVHLSATAAANITLEVDVDGTDLWIPYRSFAVEPGQQVTHAFPAGFSAYWVRAVSDRDTTAIVTFQYD